MKRSRAGQEVELDVNMAHVLMLLSRGATEAAVDMAPQSPDRVFECKTCNRQFSSFQALGGHRASHKKPRLLDEQQGLSRPAKPRVHECSICGLEFSLGQALGGHMRRHRALNNYFQSPVDVDKPESSDTISNEKRAFVDLDLNLTPMENEDEIRLLTFSLGPPLVH